MALFSKSKSNSPMPKINQPTIDDFFNCDISQVPGAENEEPVAEEVLETVGVTPEISQAALERATAEFDKKLEEEKAQRERYENRIKAKLEAQKQEKKTRIGTYETDVVIEEIVETSEIEKKLVSLEKSYQTIEQERQQYKENLVGIDEADIEKAKDKFDSYCQKRDEREAVPYTIADANDSEYEKGKAQMESTDPTAENSADFVGLAADNVEEYYQSVESVLDRDTEDSIQTINI